MATASRLLQRRSSHASELWTEGRQFSVAQGEALGIVGRNGAGKSTVLKILAE